jgi:hypothetical protein
VGSWSAILDLGPQTVGDDDYSEVGRKPSSGGLVTGSRPVFTDDFREGGSQVSDSSPDKPGNRNSEVMLYMSGYPTYQELTARQQLNRRTVSVQKVRW